MLAANQKHEVIYFQPKQLVFHLDGNPTPKSTQQLITWANEVAKKRYKDISISQHGRTVDFNPYNRQKPDANGSKEYSQDRDLPPNSGQSNVSNVDVKRIRPAIKQPRIFSLIFAEIDGEINQSELLDLILLLDRNRRWAPGGKLQVVTLNWLMSGGSEPGTVGGPAGRPVPYSPKNNPKKANTKRYVFHLPSTVPTDGKGQGVVVAILDTAPNPKDLKKIYTKWVAKRPDKHSLLRSLIHPVRGKLTVHPDAHVTTAPLSNVQVDGHEYDMNDHGLFVAGIIHSIAPKAELHLYQVLNKYGVGDLETFARNLGHVHDNFLGKQRLVVNLSLTLNLPLEEGHLNNDLGWKIMSLGQYGCDNWICRMIRRFICRIFFGLSWFERRVLPMVEICNNIYALDSRVIAAAGNYYDETRQSQRPQACYPAAFNSVLGVGALSKERAPSGDPMSSSYSNLADSPPTDGITTLGGEEGANKGILGIYIGRFPRSIHNPTPKPNVNGWGWWAGTSFATAIISGAAALMQGTSSTMTTQEAIERVLSAGNINPETGEHVFDVTQP